MAPLTASAALDHLQRDLDECMARDRARLADSLRRLRASRADARQFEAQVAEVSAAFASSRARVQQRRAHLPAPDFPASLPVSQKRDQIAQAIAAHPVVIVCGETGSGKTTQLPKICLALGRGVAGLIGHTQPRRIAARTVAARVAQELASPLGALVGYKIRFQDKVGDGAYVKVMTDGILLAETQGDRRLCEYDTLIIDEAHERSLNIDFLLGYLHRLLPERPDLKVIITSATIDAGRFSRHFGNAPVVEVSGRLYPVEIRYAPAGDGEDEARDGERDMTESIVAAVDHAARLGPGHVLVFLPGEREIRLASEALRKHHPPATEILPLYARLSAADQERVFAPTQQRRIVLATNVAETSLTVPGIRYVIDPGTARINRYSYRRKVEQLVTEKISQASANQRAGRCGRVMNGVCIRLYSREDEASRPAYTDPEILRSSLAAVILRMQALDLGAIESFPFIEAPAPRMIADGYQLLAELGAVDDEQRITERGRALAHLPLDPRIGRMLLAAREHDCLAEVLVIAAALSVQDPRERPLERAQAADDRHAPFVDDRSDFVGLLALWRFYDECLRHKKSNRKLADELRAHFLAPARMREWREIHGQLAAVCAEMGMRPNTAAASYEQLHRALLCGLLGNVGAKNDDGDFDGARAIRFVIHPASGLRKRPPRWVVAAELVETSRLFARTVAQVEAEWIERAASHLVRRTYHEPRWEKETARVVAWEQVTLYGLVLVARRKVHYGPIDPQAARAILIRAGLVEGGYESDAPFLRHNRRLRQEVEELEHKSRRRDVLVDEDRMVSFYEARVGAQAINGAGFEAWRREAEREAPRLLFMRLEDLMRHRGEGVTAALYPARLESGGLMLDLRYRFDPAHPLDGVTATVPLAVLNALSPEPFEWVVPGFLREKVNALVRALPKPLRRACAPLPETVTGCLEHLDRVARDGSLLQALRAALRSARGVELPVDVWDGVEIPEHLRMRFRVIDDAGQELASGRDLAALQRALGERAQERFAPASPWERDAIKVWPGDLELSERVAFRRGSHELEGFPALVDEGDHVRLTLLETSQRARIATRWGIVRLVRLELRAQVRAIERVITPTKALALSYAAWGSGEQLAEDLLRASVDRAVWADDRPVRTRAEFDARLADVRARLQIVAQEYVRLVEKILAEAHGIRKQLASGAVQAFRTAASDLQRQLERLVYAGFVAATPYAALQQLPRYLEAMKRRIAKLPAWGERDAHHTAELGRWWAAYEQRLARDRAAGIEEPRLAQFRWMLEEQRVSLFAQELRTPYPVSYKRLDRAWAELSR